MNTCLLNNTSDFNEVSDYVDINKITSHLPGMVYQFRLNFDGGSCFPYTLCFKL